MKRIIYWIVTVLLLINIIPLAASAASGTDDITITVSNVQVCPGEDIESFVVQLNITKTSLGGAKFTINYNTDCFTLSKAKIAFDDPDEDFDITLNKNKGIVSLDSMYGTEVEGAFLELTFKLKEAVQDDKYSIGVTVNYFYDADYDKLNAAVENGFVTFGHSYDEGAVTTPPSCTEPGEKTYTCTCGDSYTEEIPASGHNTEGVVDHKDATCTEPGVVGGTYCTVCNHGKAEAEAAIDALGHDWTDATCTAPKTCERCQETEGEALGHDEVSHEAKAPTCTEIGWNAYVTCNRCDYTTYEEKAALGEHLVQVALKNDSKYPFSYNDGIYTSTNKGINQSWPTFTITADGDCTLNVSYKVSCEYVSGHRYDRLEIKHNGKELVKVSGDLGWAELTVELKKGDTLTIQYIKDASNHYYDDNIQFKINTTAAQTCEDIECVRCGAVVYNGLGHSYDEVVTAPTFTAQGYTTYTCSGCDDSYTADYVDALVPIKQKGSNLSYTDMIYVIDIFDLTLKGGNDVIDPATEAGLLVWSVAEYEAMNGTIVFNSDNAIAGLKPYPGGGYYGISEGIYTKYLSDKAYYCGYVMLDDGTYVFSEAKLYSPVIYAYNMLNKESTSKETKDLCVALLNYIAAAQVHFGYNTANLANSELTDAQKAITWDNSALNTTLPTVPDGKQVEKSTDVFKGTGKNLKFDEMVRISPMYKIDDDIIAKAQECGTIFWTVEQFNALTGAPSLDNIGTGTVSEMQKYKYNEDVADQWYSIAPGTAAKDMADTVYYMLGYVVDEAGNVHYSGVMVYSVEQYVYNTVNKASASESMKEFAKRLFVYERAAKAALGNDD